VTIFSCSHLISRDGEQIQPIPYGCFGSAPSGIRDLVRESRVQNDWQRLPHAAPLAQTQPHHPDFTSPARQALGSAFATSTRGAASRGTPQLPHMGRDWHVATQHHGQRGHRFVITCLGVICADTITCCGTSVSQGGLTSPSPFPFGMHNTAARTYAFSINTNFTEYEDLPGHHLLSIRNLIASSPDESYPETASSITDDINFFMNNFTAEEAEDYSGICDPDALRSF